LTSSTQNRKLKFVLGKGVLGKGVLGNGDDNDTRSEAATRYNSEIFRFDEILSWIK